MVIFYGYISLPEGMAVKHFTTFCHWHELMQPYATQIADWLEMMCLNQPEEESKIHGGKQNSENIKKMRMVQNATCE